MRIIKKFVVLHALWSAGIMLLIVPISLTVVEPLELANYLRWLGHSLALATFPAGLMIGAELFRSPHVWRLIGWLALVELGLMLVVLLLLGFAAPMSGLDLLELTRQVRRSVANDWLSWNQMAWTVYMTAAEVLSVPIFAGLGMMLGAWAEQVLPVTFRRILFWAMSLKMVGFTYLITENSYEMFVVRTNGPAAISAFFMLLIPLGMYGGLILPSIGLARRARAQ